MSLRLQRGNLSNSCMDIPKISQNTSGAKWRWEERSKKSLVLTTTPMTFRCVLQFVTVASPPWSRLLHPQVHPKSKIILPRLHLTSASTDCFLGHSAPNNTVPQPQTHQLGCTRHRVSSRVCLKNAGACRVSTPCP